MQRKKTKTYRVSFISKVEILNKNRRPPWCAELMGSEGGHIKWKNTHKTTQTTINDTFLSFFAIKFHYLKCFPIYPMPHQAWDFSTLFLSYSYFSLSLPLPCAPKALGRHIAEIRYRILWLRFRNQNVDQTLKQPRTMDTPVWRTRYLKCSLQGWSWSTTRFLGHGWFRVRPIFQHTIQKRLDLKSRPNKWTI